MVTGVALGSLLGALVKSSAGGGEVLKPGLGEVAAAVPALPDAEEVVLSPLPPPQAERRAIALHTKTHEKVELLMGTSPRELFLNSLYVGNLLSAEI
jgi:hypothetical protein